MADGQGTTEGTGAGTGAGTGGAAGTDANGAGAGGNNGGAGTGTGGDTGVKDTSGAGDAGTKTTIGTGGTGTGTGGTGDAPPPPADWPADWRTKGLTAAGVPADDKKALAMLERLASPGDMVKKLLEQEKLISSGKLKSGLPENATEEQVAAWRKDNNIPEAPDKYDTTLPDGLVIGESEKPIVDTMLKSMHGANLTNDQVKAVLASYFATEKNFLAERATQMAENQREQDAVLRQEWGGEYKQNLAHIQGWVSTFSQKTREALANALDSNGMPLLNNADFIRDMAIQARTINPVSTVVTGGGSNQMSSVQDEIKIIENRMATDRDGYFKDKPMQDRYLELLGWVENQKKRA